jgi:hypothetical protein
LLTVGDEGLGAAHPNSRPRSTSRES